MDRRTNGFSIFASNELIILKNFIINLKVEFVRGYENAKSVCLPDCTTWLHILSTFIASMLSLAQESEYE